MNADPELDPAAAMSAAQRKHRLRMLVMLAIAAVAVAAGAVALVMCREPEREIPAIARPYLWKVTSAAGQPSYLFGTMHIGYSVKDLPAAVLDAQARSTITVLETDLLTESPKTRLEEPAPDRLSPEEWDRAASITGVDREELLSWKSSQLLGATLASLTPRVEAMDRGLQRRAKELGKAVAFLETRQLEEVMNEGVVLDGLRQVLARPGAARGELLRLIRRYASGVESGSSGAGPVGELSAGLNSDWESTIEAHVQRGGAFIAIGNGHIIGASSILERMRRKGLRFERTP